MKTFTFHSGGSVTPFNPDKRTTDGQGTTLSSLEFHKGMVRDAGRRDVYILDHKGREVECNPSLTSKVA